MFNVLFVDDEPNILTGIQRSLRSMRNDWRMSFAESGEVALGLLEQEDYDVIVSDIRMPGMDGVQLLSTVKRDYPKIIRLALSGHAETEMEIECARAAHQFLAKPAEPELIKNAVRSSAKLSELLNDESLRSIAGGIDALPSLPELYQKIMDEFSSPEGSIVRVGEIIGEDLAMSAKVLQLVNSAFFGLSRQVDSVKQAATLLGFDIIKSLVLSQKMFSAYEKTLESGLDLEKLIRHCNHTAALARKIGIHEGLPIKLSDRAMMAGMLHNVGKLVLADQYPARYANVSANIAANNISYRASELKEFGVSHEVVGGYLLGIWGLPGDVVEAVSFHHSPGKSAACEFSPLTCVYLALSLIHAVERELDDTALMEYLDVDYLNKVSNSTKISEWLAIAREQESED